MVILIYFILFMMVTSCTISFAMSWSRISYCTARRKPIGPQSDWKVHNGKIICNSNKYISFSISHSQYFFICLSLFWVDCAELIFVSFFHIAPETIASQLWYIALLLISTSSYFTFLGFFDSWIIISMYPRRSTKAKKFSQESLI